jgi:hypothetical protein
MYRNCIITQNKHNVTFSFSHFQVHYGRALALAGLGRIEEALIAHCVSLYLDKTSQGISSVIRNDILRVS